MLLHVVRDIFKKNKPYFTDVIRIEYDLNRYDMIINIWYYFTQTDKEFLNRYEESNNKLLQTQFKIAELFCQKHNIIIPIFQNHIITKKDHVIIFYLKNSDHVLLFLKHKDELHFLQVHVDQIRLTFNKSLKDFERSEHFLSILCCE